jgi:hypothetical protein
MFEVTDQHWNKDLLPDESYHEAHERYRNLWGNFTGNMPEPVIEKWGKSRWILRTDLAPAGLKAFGAEKLVAETEADTLVYVAPRVGHAPDAIAALAQMYGKRCVFFCPAAKEMSRHQRSLLAYDNVELKFFKIAAMPTLNVYAKRWAAENDAAFLPFGLTGTPLVTAGLVNLCRMVTAQIGWEPSAAFMAVSTGTMIRALQIGWPDADMYGIAVARNVKDGEIGRAEVFSHSMPFLKDEHPELRPPFPSTSNYDAKAWTTFDELAIPQSIFINVGSDEHIERNLSKVADVKIESQREWHDMTDWGVSQDRSGWVYYD